MTSAKYLAPALLLALLSIPPAHAQVTIDVSKISCEQFVLYQVVNSDYVAVWLDGYYSSKRNNTLVDPQALKDNINKVRDYCRTNLKTTIMQAVENLSAGK
jgi:acid stress chaperone HdeB